jgi:uncharacterized protein YukE
VARGLAVGDVPVPGRCLAPGTWACRRSGALRILHGMSTSNQITVDPVTFKADLGDLEASITLVQSRAGSIEDEYRNITSQLMTLSSGGMGVTASAWSSPAGGTFTAVATQLSNAMSTLQNLLNDMVSRMQQTYSNYVQTETANTQNLTP